VALGRRAHVERFVGLVLIGLTSEVIEPALLSTVVGCRSLGGPGLERSMHALTASVLLSSPGLDTPQ
jgi:hypothetical protein